MAIDLEELEHALSKFRLDIINRMTELSIQIDALQAAVLEAPVSKKRSLELQEASRKIQHKFRDVHAQSVSPPHQLR